MPSSSCGLLLVLLTLFQDMAVSFPINGHHGHHRHHGHHDHHGNHCKWDEIKDHARNLNDLAMKFYNRTQAKDVYLENPKIQCENRCGPADLSLNKTHCLQHIHYVLSYYNKTLDVLTDNDLNNDDKGNDINSIKKIITHLLDCLEEYADKSKTIPPINATPTFVKNKFGTPLASSSSMIARVFAAGNPDNHLLLSKEQ